MKDLVFCFKYLWSKTFSRDIVFEQYFRGQKVLDIGCGRGEFLRKDPENFFGIDANPVIVRYLQENNLQATLAEATSLPFPDDFFGAISCRNIIEHLAPTEAFLMLRESVRVLLTGGHLILITPMPASVWSTFGHIKPYPPMAIKKVLRQTSLERFDSLQGLKIKNLVYLSYFSGNKFVFALTTFLANVLPVFRGSYVMILRKD